MNNLPGRISAIFTHGNLSIVHIDVAGVLVKSIIIETPETADYLEIGHPIRILFKETEVIIARNSCREISLQSRFPCIIERIDQGQLMSKIRLRVHQAVITAIITSDAVRQLHLATGDQVLAMVKTNEIMLSE